MHLGIDDDVTDTDCICDDFYNKFRHVSIKNTMIFNQLFPTVNIQSSPHLEEYLKQTFSVENNNEVII